MSDQYTKRDVARIFGVPVSEVTKWVNDGCPCEPSGKLRSALLFDMPKTFRWWLLYRAEQHSPHAAALMKRELQIAQLEAQLEQLRGTP